MDYNTVSVEMHRENKGKLEVCSKIKVTNKDELSVAYTPGVAEPCRIIAENKEEAFNLTSVKNTVAVISDGSAVLGLGNIGPLASLPVMEGKSLLFKEFAGVNSFPIVLATQDTQEIIDTIKNIAPTFGGINLEDISAPRCFEIENKLKEILDIPVFHDDQHGTAIVVLSGIINGLKLVDKKKEDLRVVVNGAGAAGIAVAKLLLNYGIKDIIICDSKGIIYKGRDNVNWAKLEVVELASEHDLTGSVYDALVGSDVFIGVSKGNLLNEEHIKLMNKDSMIFAMANPIPEIMPDIAKSAGAKIVATGRSDFPNQLNNVLAFPGIFKGVFESGAKEITEDMKLASAIALANCVENVTEDMIIPNPFDENVVKVVSNAVIECVLDNQNDESKDDDTRRSEKLLENMLIR